MGSVTISGEGDIRDLGGYVEIYDNKTGCSNAVEILEACETISTDDMSQGADILIFPIPANTHHNIKVSSRIDRHTRKIEIMNVNGIVLISGPLTELVTTLDIDKLSQGVYFVILTDEKSVHVKKFVKN